MKTLNPYPQTITDDSSDEVVPCHDHIIWQKGADTRDKDYGNLIDKIVDIYKEFKAMKGREPKRKRHIGKTEDML